MRSVLTVIKEQFQSFYLVRRLSVYEMKSANSNNYLGVLWEIINPMIQIAIYWFVFGFGIFHSAGRGDVELSGELIPYFPWMLSGIVVWFFINQAILQGSKSVYTRIKMISKMSFPMSVIPTFVIFSKLYQHLMLLAVVLVIFQFLGYPINIFYIQLPYFIISTIVFLVALSLITSTISTIVRDFQMLIQSLVRILIYLSPFLWPPYHLQPEIIQIIMKLNPIYYLAEGYRASILGLSWYPVEHWEYTLYFWGITVSLLIFGSILHVKFRDRFVDFL
ncbi:teichoic acid transport system permease protein [Cytobacillus firmus]|uniref:Transport permease protein n=2 Tax=Cytobacillus TaxID=2675230 RepID=A0A366JSH7_CYTFI|nr:MULTISPECIES: ABC transporter permease [Cytobacillus]RBP91545.1 teichoic acid transport system permease protein [Cytobacillus firmus]TDX41745.1 teichoic acid transport system permease protein [Cytobacillus oceanisediminis]